MAINLNEALKAEIYELLKILRVLSPEAKWVLPEQLHLTLSFLGELENYKVPFWVDSMKKKIKHFSSFKLYFQNLGFFSSGACPKVFWLGVQGDIEPLKNL